VAQLGDDLRTRSSTALRRVMRLRCGFASGFAGASEAAPEAARSAVFESAMMWSHYQRFPL
jgi:hypothetical protein